MNSGGTCVAISGTLSREYYVQAASADKVVYSTAELTTIN